MVWVLRTKLIASAPIRAANTSRSQCQAANSTRFSALALATLVRLQEPRLVTLAGTLLEAAVSYLDA
jgi:hypothetical protein